MPDVYLPLPYTPRNPNKEPRVLFLLGSIYNDLVLGEEYELRSAVGIFANTYFTVMVTGFYQGLALVQCPIYDVLNRAIENFFSLHNQRDYTKLSQEEYYLLYPEERLLIPGRFIGME
ncbi:hypothetical protein [Calothrix sp. UHCC 0171]|uniref:hypothetical protein n=1 Tax=Calothrix sp. UHCC 0171 TaxID=3110245 RepID=UPI002B1F70C8|nr:hypothetical protein [Calothrix sp. UHCC 0171]MEA5574449.1 hypothetical protein [Calothrix sp. UHCC 0171]